MRSILTSLSVCAVCALASAQDSASSLAVATRLIVKAERAAIGARAIDTQHVVTVVLAKVAHEVDGEAGAPRFAGMFHSKGRQIPIEIAWDGTSPRARFGFDFDADGALAASEQREVGVRLSKLQPGADTAGPRAQFDVPLLVEAGGYAYGLQVRRYEDGVVRAEFTTDVDYRVGEVEVEGVAHTLLVVDWDDDARFGTAGDVFTFLPTTQYEQVPGFGPGRGFMFPIGDAALLGDRRVRLADVVGDDGVARLAVAAPDESLADYLRRRRERAVAGHAVAMADRAAEFEREEGLTRIEDSDAARIAWLWVIDARAALAAAKAQNRPLFLLYENEPDERCAQMDLYTWGDAAVVQAAQAFVCARVTLELDVERSGQAYDVRLGPAYVFCDPSGRPLRFPDRKTGKSVAMSKGFKKPKDMAAFLRACATRIEEGAFEPK